MNNQLPKKRPKIGIALSGASGRAVAHIGVLEVLEEHGIPIDIITACSSGTIIAGSYASGTIGRIKNDWFKVDRGFFWKVFEIAKTGTGMLSLDKAAEFLDRYFNGKKMEQCRPNLGFVCVDIASGEPILLSLGDMAKSAVASCAVPGLFEPVEWGNRLLVDGGLLSLVPTLQAYEMGADIVIGVDIATAKYVIRKRYINVWRGYNFLKNTLPMRILRRLVALFDLVYENSIRIVFYNQSDFLRDDLVRESPDLFKIIDQAMSIAWKRHQSGELPACDIMLNPKVKHLGKLNLEQSRNMYMEGRRVALEALPEIRRMISGFDPVKKRETQSKSFKFKTP